MNQHPLTWKALQVGAVVALLAGLLTDTLLVGYSVLVLFATVGLTWRRDEAPVFPFILLLQWVEVTSGYFFSLIAGYFPTTYPIGDIDRTMWFALSGLLVLALGIRVISNVLPQREKQQTMYVGNLTGLFWFVILVYGINYVYLINTKAFGGLDVILERVLATRQVALLLLWFEVVRQRRHKSYLWLSLAWVFVPALGSYFSDFKTPLMLILIVFAASWEPWERNSWNFSIGNLARTTAIVVAVIFLALTWQDGVKRETRKAYNTDAVGSNPIDRVRLFVTHATTAIPVVLNDTQPVVESLIARISYITFFSRALEYVPAIQPHGDGELLEMALTNAVLPRFLFPDKPVLPSDSYYTKRFTGIAVPEDNTSISIGYMAEFYSDWGIKGMFVSVFVYGVLMGLAAWIVRSLLRPDILVDPALITTMMAATLFEQQFIKGLAALIIAVIITLGILWIGRDFIVRSLDLQPVPELPPEESPWQIGRNPRVLSGATTRATL